MKKFLPPDAFKVIEVFVSVVVAAKGETDCKYTDNSSNNDVEAFSLKCSFHEGNSADVNIAIHNNTDRKKSVKEINEETVPRAEEI